MSKQLPPNPHLILSFVKRGLRWPQVIAEFVDNAFDEAAGDARSILIEIDKGSVSITDYGRGIEDINRLGILGASASYQHEGNIGQYGVGAKAWMCQAQKLEVETCFAGRLHRHTFDLAPVLKSLEKGDPRWLTGYAGKGRAATESFSRLTMRSFHPDRTPLILPALVNELQRMYWPGLLAGRTIEIIDKRRRPKVEVAVKPLKPASWSDVRMFSSEVNGRPYKATIGILSESIGAYSGLWIGHLYRTICVEKSLPSRALPARVHGQIELSSAWRHALSNYKDEIIEDRELLLLDIESRAAGILDLADEFTEDMRFENIAAEIQSVATKALEDGASKTTGSNRGSDGPRKPSGERAEKPKESEAQADEPAEKTPENGEDFSSGIRYGFRRLGHDTIGSVEIHGRTVTVILNSQCPKIEAVSRQPRYPGIYLAIGNEIAAKCDELGPSEIETLFGGMLGDAGGSEKRIDMKRAIRAWWGFVADEQVEAAA